MEFTVPKFSEREMKVVGPLTMKQFMFIGIAGVTIFLLRYFVPFPIFIISAILIAGGGIALAFIKIKGRPLPVFISNFFTFSISPKLYIWKRKKVPVMLFRGEIKMGGGKESSGEGSPLEMAGGSQLKKAKIDIEMKTK